MSCADKDGLFSCVVSSLPIYIFFFFFSSSSSSLYFVCVCVCVCVCVLLLHLWLPVWCWLGVVRQNTLAFFPILGRKHWVYKLCQFEELPDILSLLRFFYHKYVAFCQMLYKLIWSHDFFVVVQSLSRVWLFVTPWTAACQASLSITISWSLLNSCS